MDSPLKELMPGQAHALIHGISSQMAARYFLSRGFKEAYHIIGGFEAWKIAYPG